VGTGDHRNDECYFSGPPIISTDGANWTPLDYHMFAGRTPNGEITYRAVQALAFGRGRFVATSSEGDIWTSFDGQNWAYQTNLWSATPLTFASANLTKLVYINGTYIGVGPYGAILQSDPVPPDNPTCRLAMTLNESPQLALYDAASRAVRIESSSNPSAPSSWQTVTNLYPSTSPFYWSDTQSPSSNQRFYRAVVLP